MRDDLKTLERQAADDLVASFAHNPGAWKWRDADCDTLLGPSGLRLGVAYLTVYTPATVRFGFWNRRRVRRAFKRWKSLLGNSLADSERRRALLLLRQCLAEPLRAVA